MATTEDHEYPCTVGVHQPGCGHQLAAEVSESDGAGVVPPPTSVASQVGNGPLIHCARCGKGLRPGDSLCPPDCAPTPITGCAAPGCDGTHDAEVTIHVPGPASDPLAEVERRVEAELRAEEKRLDSLGGYSVGLIGNWLGGIKVGLDVVRSYRAEVRAATETPQGGGGDASLGLPAVVANDETGMSHRPAVPDLAAIRRQWERDVVYHLVDTAGEASRNEIPDFIFAATTAMIRARTIPCPFVQQDAGDGS